MARLPGADRAILDLRKIEEYCLSPLHPRGRHKARVFREVFRIEQEDAPWLREFILQQNKSEEAAEMEPDLFGRRWRIDIPIVRQERSAVIRTIWILRTGDPDRASLLAGCSDG